MDVRLNEPPSPIPDKTLAAKAREGAMLQCLASALRPSKTNHKPTNDTHQAITSLALRDNDASSFTSTGET